MATLDRPTAPPAIAIQAQGLRRLVAVSRLGFALFVVVNFLLFTRPAELFPELASYHLYEISMVLSLLLLLPQMLAQLQLKNLQEKPITAMMLVIMAMVLITPLAHGYLGLFTEYGLAHFKVLLYYLLLMSAVRTGRQLRSFLLWIAFFIIIVTLVPVLDHHGRVSFDALHKLVDVRTDPETGKDIRVIRMMSVGIFADPNDLAQITGTGVILCMYGVVSARRWLMRIFWAAPVPMMVYAIMLTESRGGLLAIGAGLATLFLAHFGVRKALIVGAICLPGLAVMLGVRHESFSTGEASAQSRVQLWSDALDGVKSNPVVGVGAGAMGEFYMDQVAHNTFLHMFGELGMLGGLAFIGSFYVAVWGVMRLWPAKVEILDPQLRTIRPFLTAAIATYGMGMMSLSRGYEVPTYTLLGMAAVYLSLTRTEPEVTPVLRMDGTLFKRVCMLGVAYLVVMHVFVRLSVRWSGG